jgi:uncharacterized protein (TIGR00255 family)
MNITNDKPGRVRSMTGYARVRRQTQLGELIISLRSVNHRALDFHFHQSGDFALFENAIRARLKQDVIRGHIEVRVSLTRAAAASEMQYDRELLGRYIAAFREAAKAFRVSDQPDLNTAFRVPGVLSADAAGAPVESSFEPEILAAIADCVRELNDFREREGEQLRDLLLQEAEEIGAHTTRMAEIRSQALPLFQKRLTERLQELLGSINIDPRRVTEEAAILIDRSDVQEELARLRIHTEQLVDLLKAGGEVGKKVDFLLQEMNRETNTILSKTSGIGEAGLTMTDLGLAAKANVEKIREQALNLE